MQSQPENLRFGLVAYVPPMGFANTAEFVQNLKKFKTKHPLVKFGYPGGGDIIGIRNDPEFFKGKGHGNKLALPNAVFFVALKMAQIEGWTHFMFVENDCRVGCDGWDDIIWQEFLSKDPTAIMGGSPVVFNPCSWDRAAAHKYERFLERTKPRFFPVPVAGSGRLAERQQTCVFVNGALAIYDVRWLWKVFGDEISRDFNKLCLTSRAYDYEIGIRMWNTVGSDAYDKVVSLEKAYSGYGELMTQETERKQWLNEGRLVAVHQIKTKWVGPDNEPALKAAYSAESGNAPTVSILIVTFRRDIEYVRYNLQSIRKFATGFKSVVVAVPEQDLPLFAKLRDVDFPEIIVKTYPEPPGKGMLNQMYVKCCADQYCDSDYVLHTDGDCIFTGPVSPADYFQDGKPVLVCRPYAHVVNVEPGHERWQSRAERALGFKVSHDYMVRHPAVHPWGLYGEMRQHIEALHKKQFRQFVMEGENEFPQSFCEFATLGAFARERFADRYTFQDIGDGPEPPNKLIQGWSKGGLEHVMKFKDGVEMAQGRRFEQVLTSTSPAV